MSKSRIINTKNIKPEKYYSFNLEKWCEENVFLILNGHNINLSGYEKRQKK